MRLSAQANAAILLRVAAKTVLEARHAWRKASDVNSLRSAFRACVLAARASQRAADAWAHDARIAHRLTDDAKRLSDAATELKTRLVRQ